MRDHSMSCVLTATLITGMAETKERRLDELRGLVASCVGIGGIDDQFAAAHEEMRVWNVENGFKNVEYRRIPCVLVESGRDECAMHALQQGYDYVLQVDADAAPFPPDSLLRLLQRAYVEYPDADVVGAYAQLKNFPYLPTIDTGTGTWEEHYPGEGVLRVLRTGGHFFLTKTSAYRKMGPAPWHRTRVVPSPMDTLREVDNFARLHNDGVNPFAKSREWQDLMDEARKGGRSAHAVGEDSGFFDNLHAVGGVAYVDTDLVTGHVMKTVITPQMLKDAMRERSTRMAAACGVLR